MNILLEPKISRQVAELYADMEAAYNRVAKALTFSCTDCPDNCCDSYFLHHTYIEWAYLWEGVQTLPDERRAQLVERARDYEKRSADMLAAGQRPDIMCPLNEAGLCALYSHRMMICRLHGVPAFFVRPDGQNQSFPGCFRCQELHLENDTGPAMERTGFFRRMVELEINLLGARRHTLPKVKMTLAEMLLKGPPLL